MQMQPGQAAGLDAQLGESVCIPALPQWIDIVVAHIGGIADEEGGAGDGGQGKLAVIANDHLDAIGETGDDSRRK